MTTVSLGTFPHTEPPTGADAEPFAKLDALIESLRPIFQMEGGDAKVISVKDGVARVAFGGGCEGCGGALSSMEGGLRLMIQEKVPGLKEVIFE
jgi:Fe-S cluster biogenesis protein NfuA